MPDDNGVFRRPHETLNSLSLRRAPPVPTSATPEPFVIEQHDGQKWQPVFQHWDLTAARDALALLRDKVFPGITLRTKGFPDEA